MTAKTLKKDQAWLMKLPETGEPQKKLDSTVKDNTMLVNEPECPAMIAGHRSYGKCRFN